VIHVNRFYSDLDGYPAKDVLRQLRKSTGHSVFQVHTCTSTDTQREPKTTKVLRRVQGSMMSSTRARAVGGLAGWLIVFFFLFLAGLSWDRDGEDRDCRLTGVPREGMVQKVAKVEIERERVGGDRGSGKAGRRMPGLGAEEG
jgi:hypothetical protein